MLIIKLRFTNLLQILQEQTPNEGTKGLENVIPFSRIIKSIYTNTVIHVLSDFYNSMLDYNLHHLKCCQHLKHFFPITVHQLLTDLIYFL